GVRVPADARQGPPRSRALAGRPRRLPATAAARCPLCGRIAEPRAAERRARRRPGAPWGGARLQFLDRDAHHRRAARAAVDLSGALHRRAALLRPGRRYADAVKLFEPYDRIRDPQPELRQDLLRLVAEALRRRVEALILVNNRLEGNAPGTIRALVDALTGVRS